MLTAFLETFRTLRTNFFQTFLSVLGVIIGVGALVAMLAMIDGLENWGERMIADKSSLENLAVRSKTGDRVDGIYVARDTIARLNEALVDRLLDSLPPARGQLVQRDRKMTRLADSSTVGLQLISLSFPLLELIPDSLVLHGPLPNGAADKSIWVNEALALRLGPDSVMAAAVGQTIRVFDDTLTVAGVTKGQGQEDARYVGLLSLGSRQNLRGAAQPSPLLNLAFDQPSDVLPGKEITDRWLARQFPEIDEPFESIAQIGYLEELRKGTLVFRLVMGFLIGIAVVVGGIGVMNVLLMSINERTAEIGIRKAVGASRGTIIRQFLAEAVAISVIGCFFGVLLGMAAATVGAAGMTYFVDELDFSAAFTFTTLVVVVVVALLIGVIFGTYPARKAAGLDPVAAIQR